MTTSPPPPTTSPPASRWKQWVFRGCLGIAAYFAVMMFLGALGIIKPRLERVAIFRAYGEYGELLVCPASDLHDCRLRVGMSSGRDQTASIPTIIWQRDCDTQRQRVHALCAGEYPITDGNEQQVQRNLMCQAINGVIENRFMRLGDPRDPHLPENEVRLECREGELSATFRDGRN